MVKKDTYFEGLTKGIRDQIRSSRQADKKTTQRILMCGDRRWSNAESIGAYLDEMIRRYGRQNLLIIEGGADGADTLCRQEALLRGITVCTFHANWSKFKAAAGPIRNKEQLRWGKPDRAVAFHRFIGNSKGTKDMVKQCESKGVPVTVRTK